MKNKFTYLTLLVVAVSMTNCKKDKPSEGTNNQPAPSAELSLATASVASMGVATLYGSPHAPGALVDGNGSAARFNFPLGLQLMLDGTIYVADTNNDAIRKISSTGNVSTVPIKSPPSTSLFKKPVYIGVEQGSGTFHFVLDGFDDDPYDAAWIAKSNGDLVTFDWSYYTNATALARDPYTDIFYYSRGGNIIQHIAQKGEIYGDIIPYDVDKLSEPEEAQRRGFSWDALAFGYNKVVYFSKDGTIYKYTPGGETAIISEGYGFKHITSMILNKDSRTMYVADNGYIKRVDGKKVTVLAGPKDINDGHDGSAKDADVYAFGLALAKGENELYFTDPIANTIRKIYLK